MNFNIPALLATSRTICANAFDRQLALEAALALYLAQTSPLPVEKVSSPNQFFIGQVKASLNARLDTFNEVQVINLDRVTQLTHDFWMMRYLAVHTKLLNPDTKVGFVDGLVRADVTLDEATHAFLNAHKATIYRLYNQMISEAVVLLVHDAI